jgi:hypothetical protein
MVLFTSENDRLVSVDAGQVRYPFDDLTAGRWKDSARTHSCADLSAVQISIELMTLPR